MVDIESCFNYSHAGLSRYKNKKMFMISNEVQNKI